MQRGQAARAAPRAVCCSATQTWWSPCGATPWPGPCASTSSPSPPLEASVGGPATPTHRYLHADPEELRRRAERLADEVGGDVVPSAGAVGGGSAPGLDLPGWAVALPAAYAEKLRLGDPCVVARVERGRCLVDLRCVEQEDDPTLVAAIRAVEQ